MNRAGASLHGPAANGRQAGANGHAALTPLEAAILQAVAYAGIFDFPLTAAEIHRNLPGIAARQTAVRAALANSRLVPQYLTPCEGYYTLAGQERMVAVRRQRQAASAALWPQALAYGLAIARVPFVRMVAVTGALAVNNARIGDDIDYLVVTEPGRLWVCRALVILLVKRAARRGHLVCPNYFLSEQALALPEHDLFTAHELLQMVPLSGFKLYGRMLALNAWAGQFLPNAFARQTALETRGAGESPGKRALEKLLRTPPGAWLERWEMQRKIAKFNRQLISTRHAPGTLPSPDPQSPAPSPPLIEVFFSAERCKGHFDQHGRRTLRALSALLDNLAESEPPPVDQALAAPGHRPQKHPIPEGDAP